MAIVNPEDLIGRSVSIDPLNDSTLSQALFISLVEDHAYKLEDNKERLQFLLKYDSDDSEEIISYNELLEYLAKDENSEVVWKFQQFYLTSVH